ncbi:hypothetical protein V0288_09220 [Pannus brasiliensis CCIBt3594]|uniref:Uncharacterized protein n=1 Tax=Pannus brasiliensis CCIBt3594 TaxID=1427578 RepID=A0AAW9QUN1_9CHRO
MHNTEARRASDTYVPLSLVIHAITTIGALVGLWITINAAIANQEKRMTTLEVRMERLDEVTKKLEALEEKCSFK